MKQFTLLGLALFMLSQAVLAEDKPPKVRPITEANTVFAIVMHDFSLRLRPMNPSYSLILAIWPDGYVVWSRDRLRGGPPYYSATIEPQKIANLIVSFEKDGLFSIGKVNAPYLHVDSPFIELHIKAQKKVVQMSSSHQLAERTRIDELRKESANELFYRVVWSEIRASLADQIPNHGQVNGGKPLMKSGILTWHEHQTEPAKKE